MRPARRRSKAHDAAPGAPTPPRRDVRGVIRGGPSLDSWMSRDGPVAAQSPGETGLTRCVDLQGRQRGIGDLIREFQQLYSPVTRGGSVTLYAHVFDAGMTPSRTLE